MGKRRISIWWLAVVAAVIAGIVLASHLVEAREQAEAAAAQAAVTEDVAVVESSADEDADDAGGSAAEVVEASGSDETSETDETGAAGAAVVQGDFRPVAGEASETPATPAVEVVPDDQLPEHEDSVVLVRVADGTTRGQLEAMLADQDYVDPSGVSDEELDLGLVRLPITDGTPVGEAAARLTTVAGVENAQPNFVYTLMDDTAAEADAAATADTDAAQAAGADADAVGGDSDTAGDDAASADATGDGAADDADLAAALSVNDPFVSNQWALSSIGAQAAWDQAFGATGAPAPSVAVAVLDTGCDVDHEDFKTADGRSVILASHNAQVATSGNAAASADAVTDEVGHGTHVAGIVSAAADNGKGVVGISHNAGLVVVKASKGDTADFDTQTLVAAYEWVLQHATEYNIRVINLSVGGYQGSAVSSGEKELLHEIDRAYAAKILTVAAAGNFDSHTEMPYSCFPGDHETALSVMNLQSGSNYFGKFANTTNNVSLYSLSNYNEPDSKAKDVCAPGTSILSTYSRSAKYRVGALGDAQNGWYVQMSGTSMATPAVSAVAALVFTANPGLTAQQAMNVIEHTCTDLGASGWDEFYGYGEVSAAGAVGKAHDGTAMASTEEEIGAINPTIMGPTSVALRSTATYQLNVGTSSTEWSSYDGLTWKWTSSNPDVATVATSPATTTEAVVTSRGRGKTVLTARCVADPSITATFEIEVTSTITQDISATVPAQTYTGAALTPKPTVTCGGATLAEGTDYEIVGYENNTNAGTARLTIRGKGEFEGTATVSFTIAKAPLSEATVTLDYVRYTYDGKAKKPHPTVTYHGLTLKHGSDADFTMTYSDNVNPGTGTLTIKATSGGNFTGSTVAHFTIAATSVPMYRLYNPNSGEHFYTAKSPERDSLVSVGWNYEGVGWTAPSSGDPVYRLYNPNAGDHHYTTSAGERDSLVTVGWNYEGVGWYSGGSKPLWRQYNPNAVAGAHNYTTSKDENDYLVSVGWRPEGIGWYGL